MILLRLICFQQRKRSKKNYLPTKILESFQEGKIRENNGSHLTSAPGFDKDYDSEVNDDEDKDNSDNSGRGDCAMVRRGLMHPRNVSSQSSTITVWNLEAKNS